MKVYSCMDVEGLLFTTSWWGDWLKFVLLLLVTHALIRLNFVLLACRRSIEVGLIIWRWEEVDTHLQHRGLWLLTARGARVPILYLILRRLALLILIKLLLLF